MDNLTHTLAALVLARAGLTRLGSKPAAAPYATATLAVAANTPDIDLAYLLGGTTTYLDYHRTWTHSLVGAAVLGAGVALAFWRLAQRRQPVQGRLRTLLLVGCLGGLSHSLMDWTTPYGTQLLWPANRTWYALDWFSLIDPWLLAILLLGLALPALLGLIGEEIGARRSGGGERWGAWLALGACVLLAAGRATLHADAVAQLESRLYRGRTPLRVGAFPTPLNPFRWNGVAETDSTFEAVALARFPASSTRGDSLTTFYKPSSTPPLDAALATRTARVFLAWARFPQAEVSPIPGGWRVRLRDLRYHRDAPRPRLLVVWIELDARLEVMRESLRMGRPEEEPPP